MKAVLVTGSTGGIGTATVELLRRRGVTVYAGARGPADFGPEVRVVPLDVADPESVAAAAKRIGGEVDGLSAVINMRGGLLSLGDGVQTHLQRLISFNDLIYSELFDEELAVSGVVEELRHRNKLLISQPQ